VRVGVALAADGLPCAGIWSTRIFLCPVDPYPPHGSGAVLWEAWQDVGETHGRVQVATWEKGGGGGGGATSRFHLIWWCLASLVHAASWDAQVTTWV
jgi:hypothetical protein